MKQKKKYLILIGLTVVVSNLMFWTLVFAQTAPQPCGGGKIWSTRLLRCVCPPGQTEVGSVCELKNPSEGQLVNIKDFGTLLKNAINLLLMFAGAIAVLFFIVGGYQYIVARGNEEGMEQAKKTMSGALIGIVLIIMSFAIVNIVNTLLTRPATTAEQAAP